MRKFGFIYISILLSSSLLQSQSAVKNWVFNYYSSVRTLGDASVESQHRSALQSNILNKYFRYETSLIFNDLRPNGQEIIPAREYFDNLKLDFPKGFEIEGEILNDISFNKDGDLAIVIKQQIKNMKSGKIVGGNYQIVVAINSLSLDGFNGYIKNIFPYVPVIDEKTEQEKQKEAAAVEAQIWEYTQKVNNKEGFEEYILNYPNSKFLDQAKKRAKELLAFEEQEALVQDSMIEAVKREVVLDQRKKYRQDSLDLKKLEAMAKIEDVKISNKKEERKLLFSRLDANMVSIEGGSFILGCESSDCDRDEGPMIFKTVEPFYISKFEVTIEEWVAIVGSMPINMKRYGIEMEDCNNCPITMVTFHDAINFIRNLNKITGKTYRLPYEYEWEYAAMGAKENIYSGSDNAYEAAEFRSNNGIKPVSVFSTKENSFGLYGMSGNVAEWCQDWYAKDSYSRSSSNRGSKHKVVRGGSWNDRQSDVRVKSRGKAFPEDRRPTIGFRIARDKDD